MKRQHRAHGFEAGPEGHHVERHHHEDADQDVAGARASDDHQALIDQEGDHQDIDDAGDSQAGQRDE